MLSGFLLTPSTARRSTASPAASGSARASLSTEGGRGERELAEARKYGRFERANPGPDGSARLKITHKGIVYITDATGNQEITSWRIDGKDENLLREKGRALHTVIVVDHSGSMRKDDVPGYESRTCAVYDSLARDFIAPQLQVSETDAAAGDAVVSLIEMRDNAHVAFERCPISQSLLSDIEGRKHQRAYSHGNYIPALDAVETLLERSADLEEQIVFIFLSDGAPSDHVFRECMHGVRVWEQGTGVANGFDRRGRPKLKTCRASDTGWTCRRLLQEEVERECRERILDWGDIFGRDSFRVHTVAFGPAAEDYKVLRGISVCACLCLSGCVCMCVCVCVCVCVCARACKCMYIHTHI
jgi:hypothetical protein